MIILQSILDCRWRIYIVTFWTCTSLGQIFFSFLQYKGKFNRKSFRFDDLLRNILNPFQIVAITRNKIRILWRVNVYSHVCLFRVAITHGTPSPYHMNLFKPIHLSTERPSCYMLFTDKVEIRHRQIETQRWKREENISEVSPT